jgi:vacuolar-type H+-ATPase subunit E/Vma4
LLGKDQKIATQFQKRIEEIADKTEQSEQRLAEKEKEAENMKKRLEAVEQIVKKMFVYEYDIDIDLKHPEVLTILPLQNLLSVEICTVLIGCLKP